MANAPIFLRRGLAIRACRSVGFEIFATIAKSSCDLSALVLIPLDIYIRKYTYHSYAVNHLSTSSRGEIDVLGVGLRRVPAQRAGAQIRLRRLKTASHRGTLCKASCSMRSPPNNISMVASLRQVLFGPV